MSHKIENLVALESGEGEGSHPPPRVVQEGHFVRLTGLKTPAGKNRRVTRRAFDEILDTDYWNKLSNAEQQWLVQFTLEFYQADFNFDEPMHASPEHRKDCLDRNNHALRQVGTASKASIEKTANKKLRKSSRFKKISRYYTQDDYDK